MGTGRWEQCEHVAKWWLRTFWTKIFHNVFSGRVFCRYQVYYICHILLVVFSRWQIFWLQCQPICGLLFFWAIFILHYVRRIYTIYIYIYYEDHIFGIQVCVLCRLPKCSEFNLFIGSMDKVDNSIFCMNQRVR